MAIDMKRLLIKILVLPVVAVTVAVLVVLGISLLLVDVPLSIAKMAMRAYDWDVGEPWQVWKSCPLFRS